jgi:hypothetical protein
VNEARQGALPALALHSDAKDLVLSVEKAQMDALSFQGSYCGKHRGAPEMAIMDPAAGSRVQFSSEEEREEHRHDDDMAHAG